MSDESKASRTAGGSIRWEGPKLARPVTSREEYFALRNAPKKAKNFYDGRGGDETAKGMQKQFNYDDLLPDGVLKGCKHPSSNFAHDIDSSDAQEQMRLKEGQYALSMATQTEYVRTRADW